jgi:hypothetical protein
VLAYHYSDTHGSIEVQEVDEETGHAFSENISEEELAGTTILM